MNLTFSGFFDGISKNASFIFNGKNYISNTADFHTALQQAYPRYTYSEGVIEGVIVDAESKKQYLPVTAQMLNSFDEEKNADLASYLNGFYVFSEYYEEGGFVVPTFKKTN